jgi:hypothetical protein
MNKWSDEGIHVSGPNSGVQIIGGGSNEGGNHITTVGGSGEDPQSVGITSTRRLPFSLGWLNTLAAAFAVLTFMTGWQGFQIVDQSDGLVDALEKRGWLGVPTLQWCVVAVVTTMAISLMLWTWSTFLRRHVMKFSRASWLPVLVGARCRDGKTRPMLVRLSATCQECGRKMRFLNRETEWIDWLMADGRRKHEVRARRPHAVCSANPDHAVLIDIAKSRFHEPIW